MWLPCLYLFLLSTVAHSEEIADSRPRAIIFTVEDCEDCETAGRVWRQLPGARVDLVLEEVNCDQQEELCTRFEISTLPTILFVSGGGIREFQDSYTLDNVLEFIRTSDSYLNGADETVPEATSTDDPVVYLSADNLDLIGDSHSLVYFMYDEETDHVEDFVLTLRAHITAEFALPIYILDCATDTDLCAQEPFLVTLLPCVKYLGETLVTYTGEFSVEKIEYWLQVSVFKTRDPDPSEGELASSEEEESRFVYLTSDSEHENVAYMEGVILAFYLSDDSEETEEMFRRLSTKYRSNKDLKIFAVQCSEYNAPKVCNQFAVLPTVRHGFMGRIVKDISFSTEAEYDEHIAKLMKIHSEGAHILRRNLGKIFELTISNFGDQISRFEISFVYYYSTACNKCPECDRLWTRIHNIFANNPLVLPGRVDCNFNRGTCKQAQTRGTDIVVYYRGVYHTRYTGYWEYGRILKFLTKFYEHPPEGVFELDEEDKINTVHHETPRLNIKDEEGEAGEPAPEKQPAEEESTTAPLIVNWDNFEAVVKSSRLAFIKFFVPWCGHCQKLKPTWKLLAHSFREVTDIAIGMVNCQNEQNLCKRHMVYGYPTLFTFIDGKVTYRYREEKTLNGMINHIKEKYYQSVADDLKYNKGPLPLTTRNVWNILGIKPYSMVYFNAEPCGTCAAHYEGFAAMWEAVKVTPRLFDKLLLGVVNCTIDMDFCREAGVTQVPSIVFFDMDEPMTPEAARREPTLEALLPLQTMLNQEHGTPLDKLIRLEREPAPTSAGQVEEEEDVSPAAPQQSQQGGEPAREKKTEPVTELNVDTFKGQLKKTRFTFVKFYAPWCGHCRKLAPVWTDLGTHFFTNQDVVFAKVNCDDNEKICDKHKVSVYPTLVMFENDKKMKHTCKKRKKESLLQFVEKFLEKAPPEGASTVGSAAEPTVRKTGETSERQLLSVQGAFLVLDGSSLAQEILLPKLLFVSFIYGSQHEPNYRLLDTWDRLATMYIRDTRVQLAVIDCEKEAAACEPYREPRRDYPQLVMFADGTPYECLERSEYRLIEYIERYLERPTRDEL